MIRFTCPACGRKLKMSAEHIGRAGKCPSCSTPLRVARGQHPDRPTPAGGPAGQASPSPAATTPASTPSAEAGLQRACPWCGTPIAGHLLRCPGCGVDVAPQPGPVPVSHSLGAPLQGLPARAKRSSRNQLWRTVVQIWIPTAVVAASVLTLAIVLSRTPPESDEEAKSATRQRPSASGVERVATTEGGRDAAPEQPQTGNTPGGPASQTERLPGGEPPPEEGMADGPTQPPPEKPILSQEELAQLVDPSVVTIETEDADGEESQGSGFVVDSSGLIATNYHVIEGSRKATVIFRDGTRVGVAGFVAYAPAKDLALLRIPAGGTPLQPLVLADSVPKKGEPVYAVGASFGFSNTLSDGMVSEYRSGREVSAALHKFGDLDIYRDYLGYDLDAQWVQTTAPVSPGNSGGPLVDQRGQVIGINTWVHPEGQNLNFAISAQHIKQLVATAGTTPRPLAQLPPPRSGRGTPVTGDGEKTLAAWTAVANLAEQRDAKLATSQSSLLRIQPMDPHNPLRGLRSRLSRQEKLRRDMSGAYKDYAQGLKSLDEKDVDLGVILLKFAEADLAERLSDVYEELANMAASWVPGQPIPDMNEKLGTVRIAIKDTEADLRTLRDLVRVALNEKYELTFPPF